MPDIYSQEFQWLVMQMPHSDHDCTEEAIEDSYCSMAPSSVDYKAGY